MYNSQCWESPTSIFPLAIITMPVVCLDIKKASVIVFIPGRELRSFAWLSSAHTIIRPQPFNLKTDKQGCVSY